MSRYMMLEIKVLELCGAFRAQTRSLLSLAMSFVETSMAKVTLAAVGRPRATDGIATSVFLAAAVKAAGPNFVVRTRPFAIWSSVDTNLVVRRHQSSPETTALIVMVNAEMDQRQCVYDGDDDDDGDDNDDDGDAVDEDDDDGEDGDEVDYDDDDADKG